MSVSLSLVSQLTDWGCHSFVLHLLPCPWVQPQCILAAQAGMLLRPFSWLLTEGFNQPSTATMLVGPTPSTRLFLGFSSLSFLPVCLSCLLSHTHFHMSQCPDISDVFLCWAWNHLLNYSCPTSIWGRETKKSSSLCPDADITPAVYF